MYARGHTGMLEEEKTGFSYRYSMTSEEYTQERTGEAGEPCGTPTATPSMGEALVSCCECILLISVVRVCSSVADNKRHSIWGWDTTAHGS